MLQNCVHVNWQVKLTENPIEISLESFFCQSKANGLVYYDMHMLLQYSCIL